MPDLLTRRRALCAELARLDSKPARVADAGNGFATVTALGRSNARITTNWAAVEHVIRERGGEFWS